MEHFWKSEKQFWYDREPTESERDIYGAACPKLFRHIILFRHRDDGTMWYSTAQLSDGGGNPASAEIAKAKIKNAVDYVNWCSKVQEPKESVEDSVFQEQAEWQRERHNGTYFELDDIEKIVKGIQ